MSSLEELAKALAGDQTQKIIAAENPYVGFISAPSAVSSYLTDIAKPKINSSTGEIIAPQYSAGDLLPYALATGLTSGILEGLGSDYQNTLTNRYLDVAAGREPDGSLPTSLFGSAKRQNSLFNTLRGLEIQGFQDQIDKSGGLYDMQLKKQMQYGNQQSQNKILQDFAEQAIKNPSRAARAAPYLERMGLFGTPKSEPIAVEVTNDQLPSGVGGNPGEYTGPTMPGASMASTSGRGAEGALLDDVSKEANKLMDEGAEPAQAFSTAREMLKTKRDELDRQYKRIEEAEAAGTSLKGFAGQIGMALQGAGDTGKLGEAKQWLSGWLGLGSEDQRKKYASGQSVENAGSQVVQQFGRAFKGPMSDRDVQIMLRQAPSLSNEPEANQTIIDRWNATAELQLIYSDFMRTKQAQGVDVSEAESQWNKIRRTNPFVIKGADGYEINPNWLSGDLDFGTGKKQGGASGSWGDSSDSSVSAVPSVGGNFNGQPVVRVTKKR